MSIILGFIVSGISLIISVANTVVNLASRRKKIRISILEYGYYLGENQFVLSFENCSQLPVSVSRMFLCINGERYECRLLPRTVREITHYRGEISETEKINTLPFPIYLSSLGCSSGYVVFPKSPKAFENQNTLANFQLYTNRGKIESLKVPLESTCRPHSS